MKFAAEQPDDRMFNAVEAPMAESDLAEAGLTAGLEGGPEFTAEQVRVIAAMRRQRAMLRGAGERMQRATVQGMATAEALERLSVAMELEPLVYLDPAELALQALPVSKFRVERRPAWQRVVASGWPMRFAAAACVGLVAYLGVVGISAAQSRYVAWQQERAARLAQAGEVGSESGLNTGRPQQNDVTAVAARPEPAAVVPVEVITAVPPVVVAAVAPATSNELARLGQLVILVRAKSAGQVNTSMSGLARRAREVLAVAPAEVGWQGEVIASATAALADSPRGVAMAGFMPQLSLGQPILVSYGPMAQSAVPMAGKLFVRKYGASEVGVAGGGSVAKSGSSAAMPVADARLRLADWFASRSATTHVLTLRDQPDAIDRLMRRLGGSRGVTVELVRLDAPLPEVRLSAGQNAAGAAAPAVKQGANAAGLDSLMWWTRPAGQWQRLEVPVVVVEQ